MMIEANEKFLNSLDEKCKSRISEILNSTDVEFTGGTTYYVSNDGDDSNDGLTETTPWKTLSKVSDTEFNSGDIVKFKRNNLFRGLVRAKSGVTYCAYGEGNKPKFYGWDKDLADTELWELYDSEHNIWKLREEILDCGTLVMNDGEAHSRKLIPTYRHGKFVCRDDISKPFVISCEMTQDLDIFCKVDCLLSFDGGEFEVPVTTSRTYGELYLRCDRGNPGNVFTSIEALPKRPLFFVGDNNNVKFDNLSIKYVGHHGICAAGECIKGLHVSNCELGWIGGTVQSYAGKDPNYPEGCYGSVTRFGNAIEIYGGCEDFKVENCYIYQVYDAGITHQVITTEFPYRMKDILYTENVIENCVYSIEYFLGKSSTEIDGMIENCEMSHNILRFAGCGWGQQRHNTHTPAHIKGWNYDNDAQNFIIHHNIFDRSEYRMLHLVAREQRFCPTLYENTYIQKYGHTLGQYGGCENGTPANMSFFNDAEEILKNVFKEKDHKVYYIK